MYLRFKFPRKGKAPPQKVGFNVQIKALDLSKNDSFKTTQKLARLLLHTVVKKRLHMDDEEILIMKSCFCPWLNLHGIDRKAEFCVKQFFWKQNNIIDRQLDRTERITKALKKILTDILFDATVIIDTSLFDKYLSLMDTDYIGMMDSYKKNNMASTVNFIHI